MLRRGNFTILLFAMSVLAGHGCASTRSSSTYVAPPSQPYGLVTREATPIYDERSDKNNVVKFTAPPNFPLRPYSILGAMRGYSPFNDPTVGPDKDGRLKVAFFENGREGMELLGEVDASAVDRFTLSCPGARFCVGIDDISTFGKSRYRYNDAFLSALAAFSREKESQSSKIPSQGESKDPETERLRLQMEIERLKLEQERLRTRQ